MIICVLGKQGVIEIYAIKGMVVLIWRVNLAPKITHLLYRYAKPPCGLRRPPSLGRSLRLCL